MRCVTHTNKNNRPCIDKGGKLWYNSFSDRARGTFVQKVQLSEQRLFQIKNNHRRIESTVVISFCCGVF